MRGHRYPVTEHELADVIASASDAIVSGSLDGTIRTWNEGAERLFGYSAEEMIGRSFMHLVPREDLPRSRVLHANVAEGKPPVPEFDTRGIRKDGTTIPVSLSISPLTNEAGELAGAVVIGRDISRRRAFEKQRREAVERFTGAFSNAPIGMALVALDGSFLDVNPSLCEFLGRSAEELKGMTFQELTDPEDLEEDLSLLRDLIAGAIPRYEFEKRYLRPDGSPVWGRLCGVSLVRDEEGDPHHFVSQILDINAIKQQDLELRRLAGHLRDLSLRDPLPLPAAPPEISSPGPSELILDSISARLGTDAACLCEGEGEVIRVASGEVGAFGLRVGEPLAAVATSPVASVQLGEPAATVHLFARDGHERIDERRCELVRFAGGLVCESLTREAADALQRTADLELSGIAALVAALEARDRYTAEHSRSVVDLAEAVARRLGLDQSTLATVEHVAVLHDVGKVAVPDSILQKRGPLTAAEWELMRQHPAVGERIVASTRTLAHLAAPIRAEHERWDGRGYPDGLRGEEIPVASRITLACDAYHAMTSTRPYREAMEEAEARAELSDNAGSQFDPAVVGALLEELSQTPRKVAS